MLLRFDKLQLISSFNRMINLDRLDPDWKFATNHGLANVAGIPHSATENSEMSEKGNNNNSLICKCCYEHVYKIPVPLWQNSKELEFLGFGFPLFYEFLKNCIILLFLSICSYNAISIKDALASNHELCHPLPIPQTPAAHRLLAEAAKTTQTTIHKICYTFMIELARIQQSVTDQEEALRIISFVLQLLALLYIRNRIIKLEKYYDERTTSLSDYSIFIKGIPKMKGVQKRLRDFFKKEFKDSHEIQQITLLPQYIEIEKLEAEKNHVIDSLRVHYQNQHVKSQNEEMAAKLQQLQKIQKLIHDKALETKQIALRDELECEKIICVFDTEEQKQQILEEFEEISLEKKAIYFEEGAKSIYLKEAPEPQEIFWKNANLSRRRRFFSLLLGWVLSILILVVVFVLFFFILQKKSLILQQALTLLGKHPQDEFAQSEYKGALALVYILLFAVIIFDKLAISFLFHKFTYLERHSTASKFQFSFELKMLLGLFFTTALMTLAVEAIRFKNYFSHPYGVVEEETIMFFMNSFFVPFFWLLNPTRIFKQAKRALKYGKASLTQREANELMEEEKYDVGKRFAEILEMMWFTYLYSTLIPIGAVITAFGLIFYYWVDKYNLLRRSSVTGQISGGIINTSLTLLDFTLILRPIGSIIFDSQIRTSYMVSNVIMIVVAAVYILLPKDKLIEIFNNEKFRLEVKTYREVKDSFHKTYHTEHPVYRIIHAERLNKRMIKKGLSFDESFNQLSSGLDDSLIKSTTLLQGSQTKIKIIPQIELGLN